MASQGCRPRGARPANPDAKVRWLKIAGSQTLTKGDFVILSSGLVQIALATSAELCGVVAQDCASLTAGTLVPVWADPSEEFLVIASADASSVTAGSEYDISGATGAMVMNVAASTYDVLVPLRMNPDDAVATAGSEWIAKINKHAFADQS